MQSLRGGSELCVVSSKNKKIQTSKRHRIFLDVQHGDLQIEDVLHLRESRGPGGIPYLAILNWEDLPTQMVFFVPSSHGE